MIDVDVLRGSPERVKGGIAVKNADPALVDEFLCLDSEWRGVVVRLDALRGEQKKLSAVRNIEEAKKSKEQVKRAEQELAELEEKRMAVWLKIPNLPSDDTPIGKDEGANKILRKHGEPRKFDFEPRDHIAIGESLGIIDTETAARVSGTRFGYLKGAAALLEFALVQFGLGVLQDEKVLKKLANRVGAGYSAKPFVPVVPPAMVRPDVFQKMARLEPKEERYNIQSDDLYLVGSAEHTLGPLHMDETVAEAEFPIRYAGFSTCFRREAGSYGKDTKGILRVHQFDKLEMESFTAPENGMREHGFFVNIQEYLMEQLKLPYQTVICSTGDQGDPDARHLDIEVWLPSERRHRETHSADYMTDYQARRLNTKIRRRDGKTEFVHMNDATVFAIGRTIIAILENYQTKDGRVEVPRVLQRYVGRKIIG